MTTLPLKFQNGQPLKIREERFQQTCCELEEFLEGQKHLHTKAFAKDVMFSYELKANNQIEGYADDVKFVKDMIEKRNQGKYQDIGKRVINLYHGYNYILRHRDINPDSLKHLYSLLSRDLLCKEDEMRMGEYYRTDKVYILVGGNLSEHIDEGIEVTRIEEFMDAYFNFLNNMDYSGSITEEYIKSQILM